MAFNRIIEETGPDGRRRRLFPFHISTPGLDRLVFKTGPDLTTASNFIIIQARRVGVRVVAFIVMNNHLHVLILAPSYEMAMRYAKVLKQTLSHHLSVSHKDENVRNSFLKTDVKPLLIQDDHHLRNTICYIPRNSLDTGIPVEEYKWSSYRAYFRNGNIPTTSMRVGDLPKRVVRRLLRTDMDLSATGWYVDPDGMLEPASTCDWRYAESAFYNDLPFYMRVMGTVNDAEMELVNVTNRHRMLSDKDFMPIVAKRSQELFSTPPSSLLKEQKYRLLKILYYSYCTTIPQLSRCLSLPKPEVSQVLSRRPTTPSTPSTPRFPQP